MQGLLEGLLGWGTIPTNPGCPQDTTVCWGFAVAIGTGGLRVAVGTERAPLPAFGGAGCPSLPGHEAQWGTPAPGPPKSCPGPPAT